jgi:dethiobiotin synthetase
VNAGTLPELEMKQMAKGIFVTATDTGVGKTVVSAAFIRALKLSGVIVGAMKPMETECAIQNGVMIPADGSFLRDAAEMDEGIDLVTPVRYKLPLAPYTASLKEGVPVKLEAVFKAYKQLSGKYDFMVVEGVGGILVPLSRTASGDVYFVTDLIKDLRLPAVVVTRPLLGTINHTLLTVSRLFEEGIEVKGVIVSNSVPPQGTIAEETNLEMLRELLPVPIIGVVPYLEKVTIENIDAKAIGCIEIAAVR